MKLTTIRNSIASLLVLLLAGRAVGDQRHWEWDFEDDQVNEEPAGFYFDETRDGSKGDWRVVQETASDADDNTENTPENKVLTQIDKDRARDRYALAVVRDSSIEHIKVSVRIKAVGGEADRAGGVMWRYRNSENYLVARLDASERNIRLYRFLNGNRVQFGVKEDVDIELGRWYTLRVTHRGREVKVYLDDDVMIIERDRHFRRPGRIGLWTIADSEIHFDQLRAEDLDASDRSRDRDDD
jgi:hypothetical protein